MVCIMGGGPSCGTNGYTQHRLHSFKIHVRTQELGLKRFHAAARPAPPISFMSNRFSCWISNGLLPDFAVCKGLHVQSNQTVILQVGENKIGI